jgi:hypothetical protein
MVAGDGIEPPTQGFSVGEGGSRKHKDNQFPSVIFMTPPFVIPGETQGKGGYFWVDVNKCLQGDFDNP